MKQQNLHLHELWGMPDVDELTLHLDRAKPAGLSDARARDPLLHPAPVHFRVELQLPKLLPVLLN